MPAEATLHLKQLTLFGMICRLPDNILNKIACEALLISDDKSLFGQIRPLCFKYALPHPLKSHIRNHHAQSKCTQTEVLIMLDQKVQCSKLVISSDKMIQTLDDSHESEADIKLKPFNCFYCEKNITNEQTLSEHKVKCIGVTRIFLFNQKAKRANLDNVTQPMSPVSLPMFTKSFPFPNSNPRLSHLPECVHCGLKPSCGTDMMNHMKLVHNDHRSPFEVYKKW